jgi:hypothetical protein
MRELECPSCHGRVSAGHQYQFATNKLEATKHKQSMNLMGLCHSEETVESVVMVLLTAAASKSISATSLALALQPTSFWPHVVQLNTRFHNRYR